jgi:hypothetical protein
MIYLDNKNNIFTAKGMFRASQLYSNLILKTYENKIQIIKDLGSSEVSGKNITLENGEVFFLANKNSVITLDGISLVERIETGQHIGFKLNSFFSPIANKEIGWKDEFRTRYIPIRIPSKMDLKLAYWFGIYSSRGHINNTKNTIFIEVAKNTQLQKDLVKLTKEVFDLTPDLIKKHNKDYIVIYSANVVNFLKQQFGLKNKFKKIAPIIQQASVDEQLAYVAGLSFKSYQEKSKVVFSRASGLFINYLSSILKNLGFIISKKITKSGNGSTINYLNIIGASRELPLSELSALGINFNEDIDLSKLKRNFNVKVPNLANKKVKSTNKTYESFKRIRTNKNRLVKDSVISYWDIEYEKEIFYYKIIKIEENTKMCNEISLKNSGGILLEGLILFE